ncbi:adenylate/guanylate cyclase domain-containing protein [Gemmata sp. JC717]|uniref:adenylate/guanylate cyclase domain-containing protein n=1 Tax=Gemmata algarum TaxID=2975278 RepID=UPI0021BAEFD6|nr:adenylate/guanylate cyclase domain-containing protein [Gemmata algarum]MDY3552410.1 adenylate/guanylate cyclase domain-containing protein [Gemmata algarum]
MLLVAQGPTPADAWRRELPHDAPVVLGRDAAGWSVPWEPFLARRHAELTARGGKLKVRRLAEAANPVFHAGRPADAFEVPPGGSFVIGRTSFTLAAGEAVAPPDHERPLLDVRTIGHHELDRLAFRDAPHRLDVLSRLPDVIASASDDADLFHKLGDMLLAGVRRADAVAVVALAPGADRPAVLHRDRRLAGAGDFEPSRRLVAAAVAEQKQTVLHVWGAEPGAAPADPFTLQERFDWAFCTPVAGESCPGWALYVAGRFNGAAAATLLAPWESNELRDDVKFAELVADILGSLRQVQVLRERQGVFRRFFSPGVLGVLSGGDPARALEPREADVTVLFCDLRGFSRRAEEADNLLDLLNRVSAALGLMTRNILNHRGAVADFLGDAALGFWGWPLEQPLKVEDACRAALGIRAAFETVARDPAHPLHGFRVGIGVASGRAVAGGIGTPEQAKVTVFGPVVNLASRLQDMTKLLRVPILIDEPTAEAVRERLPRDAGRTRQLVKVRPPGMETPLVVSELLPPVPAGGAPEGGLSDEDLAAYGEALTAFLAGDWAAAYKRLHRVPPDDRGKDVLTEFILKNNRTPPPGWDGVVPLAARG